MLNFHQEYDSWFCWVYLTFIVRATRTPTKKNKGVVYSFALELLCLSIVSLFIQVGLIISHLGDIKVYMFIRKLFILSFNVILFNTYRLCRMFADWCFEIWSLPPITPWRTVDLDRRIKNNFNYNVTTSVLYVPWNFIYLHFLLSLAKLLGTLIRFLFRLTKQLRIENKIVTMERSSNKMKNKKIPQYQNIYKRQ